MLSRPALRTRSSPGSVAPLARVGVLGTVAPLARVGVLGTVAALAGVGLLGAMIPATASTPATYAPGSTVRIVAHVAGLDATMTLVPIAGLTRQQARATIGKAEATAGRRTISLIAVPVHGKRSTTKVRAGYVLAKTPTLRLSDPAGLHSSYSPLLRFVLDPKRVSALAGQLTPAATVAPVDASARMGAHLILDKGYNGSTLDPTHLPGTLVKALGDGSAVLPEKPVAALYGAKTLAKVIVVSTSRNQLQLYVKGRLSQSFVVATGQAGYPSPHGSFHVIEREGAPTWTNPHDDWSMSLPDVIGPGPDNPLGTRALQLDSPGILIHGIPEVENATLGQNASHGCIRMSRAEIEQLYPEIPVGTPVLLLP